MKKTIVILSASLLAAGSSMAVGLAVANHSFESPAPVGQGWANDPGDWTEVGTTNAFVETDASITLNGADQLNWAGIDGGQSFDTLGTETFSGILVQDLLVPWAANSTYTLTILQGRRGGHDGGSLSIGVFSGTLGTDENVEGFDTWSDADITVDDTASRLVTFNTGAVAPTGNVQLFIARTDSKIYFDNITIDVVSVPEPSSAALLGLGGLALILRRRK